jgi:predicted alpha/beta-fold hydrolase
MAARHPGALDVLRVRRARGIIGFDDAVTAPLYGLGSAAEYYAWASSGPRLGAIRTPTLLITAKDDPLAPASLLPEVQNERLTRLVTEQGGHCGFVGERGTFWARRRPSASSRAWWGEPGDQKIPAQRPHRGRCEPCRGFFPC